MAAAPGGTLLAISERNLSTCLNLRVFAGGDAAVSALALAEALVTTPPPRKDPSLPPPPPSPAAVCPSAALPPLLPVRRSFSACSIRDLSARFFLHSASRFARESATAAAVEASPAAEEVAADLEAVVVLIVLAVDPPRMALLALE